MPELAGPLAGRVGTDFDDRNNNGHQDRLEQGIAGQTVQLLDTDGDILATTLSRQSGDYTFDELDLGGLAL